jgi:GNAT superfamily N-acetyltransferase
MKITRCTRAEYNEIVSQINQFWGNDRTLQLHHPMFLYEFGDTAYVIRDGGHVGAYLFGLISQTEPTAYVHLVGVRKQYRRQGLARRLYEHFMTHALARGCTQLKAITTPGNHESILFHRSLGMELVGDAAHHGISVVKDYAGPGHDRVVFRKLLR